MLEIYNEEYKDLLSKSLPAGKKHQVGCRCLSDSHGRYLRSIGFVQLTIHTCHTSMHWSPEHVLCRHAVELCHHVTRHHAPNLL